MDSLKPNVLVVDDDIEFLNIVKTYLQDVANVELASSGRQALQLAYEVPIDIILLDFEMPIMDGVKTLTNLRNLKTCINVPVIMLTGRSDRYAVMNSLVMGIDGYLLKPVDKDVLVETVLETYQKKSIKGSKKTIVAIDDDMSYLKQLNSILKENYHVIMINTARLALEYLANHVPDVIILDYQIPLFNGVTLMKMIQQTTVCDEVPFIILSGTLDNKAIRDFCPYKPVAVLAKPVEKAVLMENIEQAILNSEQDEI